MTTTEKVVAGAVAVALAVGGVAAATSVAVDSSSTTVAVVEPAGCEDWTGTFTPGECHAAGVIRFVALYNLQGAKQFCNWKAANPGEWSRLQGYSETEGEPQNIVTWFGASIRNDLQAYFATGAPTFTIKPNTAPNICKTPLRPPNVTGVTPGETNVTVTIGP